VNELCEYQNERCNDKKTNITDINTKKKAQVNSTSNISYTHKHVKQWVDIP